MLLLWIHRALLGPVYIYCGFMEVLKIHLDILYGDVEVNTALSKIRGGDGVYKEAVTRKCPPTGEPLLCLWLKLQYFI